MLRSPSIKSLKTLFGENAPRAKALLRMNREQLLRTPIGAVLAAQCYNPPSTQDIRMECLNALGDFYGVESLDTKKGECLYLNAGDTYAATLVRFNGAYRITCWGDIAERHCA